MGQPERLHILMAAGVPRKREGGAAAIAYNFGRELEQRGHQISYLFLEDLMSEKAARSRFREWTFSRRLARYIKENREKFSIVHLHAPAGVVYGLRRRWLSKVGLPPYVMLLHGLEERRVEVMKREARKRRAWNFSWKNRLWHSAYIFPRFRWAIRTADGAHAYSRDVWKMMRGKYRLADDRVAYIPNGAEERFFAAREYPGECAPRLLYVGTWLDQRGIFYIRDALRNLVRRLPALKMTFAGCGVGESEIQDFFGPDLAAHVIVRPVVAAESMPEVYVEHDIFLFPSLLEGLPSVLLEAMATGMPVITTEACGMPDVVKNGQNGVLIEPASATAIEGAVLQLAESAELRQRLGSAARETMTAFNWKRSAGELEEFFRRILALEGEAS